MRKQYKGKEDQCEKLEAKVMSMRKKINMEKNIVALDNLLEIHGSPLDRSSLGFQKGESSSHAGKNNKVEPKGPIVNHSSNKNNSNKANK